MNCYNMFDKAASRLGTVNADVTRNRIGEQKMSNFKTAIIVVVGLFITVLNGCANSNTDSANGERSISVTVTDFSGNKLQDTTVILGDRDGAMKVYATTDINGQVTFTHAPADATITTATSMSSGGTATSYSLHVDYDVNGPLSVAVPFSPPPQLPTETVLGSVTVRVTNTLSEVTQNQILTIGRAIANAGTLISTQTLSVTSSDVRGDGKLSIIVLGKDANGKNSRYGALLGQTFSNMMTLDIAVDQPISYLQHEITNIPSLAKKLHSFLHLFVSGKGQIAFNDEISLSSAPSSTTINMPYIPGIGDTVLYGVTVYMDLDQDDIIDSHQRFYLHGTPANTLSVQNFNFAMALTAPSHLGLRAQVLPHRP